MEPPDYALSLNGAGSGPYRLGVDGGALALGPPALNPRRRGERKTPALLFDSHRSRGSRTSCPSLTITRTGQPSTATPTLR